MAACGPTHLPRTSPLSSISYADRVLADIADRLQSGPRWSLRRVAEQLATAQAALPDDRERALGQLAAARKTLSVGIDELQQLARGIHPTLLSDDRQAELHASRRRVLDAADQTRRAIERDLHDGAQQRLVSLAVTLLYAERLIGRGEIEQGSRVLHEASQGVDAGLQELTQLAAGIHPAALRREGLAAALEELAGQSALRVGLQVIVAEPIDEAVEVAAYFVVAEALTNTLKHAAETAQADVSVEQSEGVLRVIVADDGPGGADIRAGSGLRGLSDRVQALGGTFLVESPEGAGTTLTALLPTRLR